MRKMMVEVVDVQREENHCLVAILVNYENDIVSMMLSIPVTNTFITLDMF